MKPNRKRPAQLNAKEQAPHEDDVLLTGFEGLALELENRPPSEDARVFHYKDRDAWPEFFKIFLGTDTQTLQQAIMIAAMNVATNDQEADEFQNSIQLWLLDLLRSDEPLSPRLRKLICGELERLWCPNPKRDRRTRNQVVADCIWDAIQEQKDMGASKAECDASWLKVAGLTRFNSVAALEKWLSRNRTKDKN